ncbi:glycoside hydrolase family 27 protein [Streptomyces sp. NPDC015139]|uniref:glycoside hydrolase family 27 protein n=1 Tax=Streptomyces sp. NPDC015139 TaxID=3364942 RepID=UPI0036FB4482
MIKFVKPTKRLTCCVLAGALLIVAPPVVVTSLAAIHARPNASTTTASASAPTKPYMGWNPFYGLGDKFTEGQIKAQADALKRRGLASAGYNVVWLDAGWWSGQRDDKGKIVPNSNFPSGMASLASYVHSKGLKIGIYTDAGRDGCGGKTQGSYDHVQQDMDTFAAWGYDAVKVDFCGAHEMKLDPSSTYQKYQKAIFGNSSHRPMIFNICNPFQPPADSWKFGPYTGTSWRTTTDIAFGPPASVDWVNVLRNMRANAEHPEAQRSGAWNDPDYLQTGRKDLTDTESRSQFSMWSIMGSPLIIGTDVQTMSAASLTTLTNEEVIAVDQDPLGAQGVPVGGTTTTSPVQVWSKRLASPSSRAVALFNTSDVARDITVSFADTGLSGSVKVRDLWKHQDVSAPKRWYTAHVAAHAVAMLKLTGKPSSAWSDTKGQFASDPAVTSQGPDSVNVFGGDTGGSLWHRNWTGEEWTTYNWAGLGGPTQNSFAGTPAATSQVTGRLDVVVRGKDSKVYRRVFENGTWTGTWESLGGTLASSPAAVSRKPGDLDIFGRGADGALQQKTFSDSRWGQWVNLGGPRHNTFTGTPSAVATENGIDVVVTGTDHAVYLRSYTNGTWSKTWLKLGGATNDSPAIANGLAGHHSVFIHTSDGDLMQQTFNGKKWSGWSSLARPQKVALNGSPAAVSAGGGLISLVVKGSTSRIYQSWQTG